MKQKGQRISPLPIILRSCKFSIFSIFSVRLYLNGSYKSILSCHEVRQHRILFLVHSWINQLSDDIKRKAC